MYEHPCPLQNKHPWIGLLDQTHSLVYCVHCKQVASSCLNQWIWWFLAWASTIKALLRPSHPYKHIYSQALMWNYYLLAICWPHMISTQKLSFNHISCGKSERFHFVPNNANRQLHTCVSYYGGWNLVWPISQPSTREAHLKRSVSACAWANSWFNQRLVIPQAAWLDVGWRTFCWRYL